MSQSDHARALRQLLQAAHYTTDSVLERIGDQGQEGLQRNSTIPADTILAGATDQQASLIRLFILQQEVDAAHLSEQALSVLHAAGLVRVGHRGVRAIQDVRPYANGDRTAYLVSDLVPGLDGAAPHVEDDYVLGASPASLTLASITPRRRVGSALDLGTGCGVQAVHLSSHSDRVVATDVNPRALASASLSCELSGAQVELRQGSAYAPVRSERFDLIVSNPPYVMSPPDQAHLAYRETGRVGDAIVEELVRGSGDHLAPNGNLLLLTNWAILPDIGWDERLESWVPPGFDCWVIERERLDRFAYIELWLNDAGLAGTPAWAAAYQQWLDYFEHLQIENIGMGWMWISNAGRPQPQRRFEQWPHDVSQPLGGVFDRHARALDLAQQTDEQLLASRPRLRAVKQEQIGLPGATDPQHIVLRQVSGLQRAMQTSSEAAACLGALDGDLSVGQVIDALAQILELEPPELTKRLLPTVRQALKEQYLVDE